MKDQDSTFTPLSDKFVTSRGSNHIIKHKDIRDSHTKKIMIREDTKPDISSDESDDIKSDISIDENEKKQSLVEPIMEGDRVLGIIHTCMCGEKSEIRFEVDNSNIPETTEGSEDVEGTEDSGDMEATEGSEDVESTEGTEKIESTEGREDASD